jgi:hypothetical protein
MLMPDINHPATLLKQPRSPVHISVAQQRKTGAYALAYEGTGEDVIDMCFGFIIHHCNF